MSDFIAQYPVLIILLAVGIFFTAVSFISNRIVRATNSEIRPPKNDLERNLRMIGIFDRDIDRWTILKNIGIRAGVFYIVALVFFLIFVVLRKYH
jgi:hypothetical protein